MYSFSRIENAPDCDFLLTWASKEKADLTLKKLNEEHSVSDYGDTSVEIGAVLQGVIAELAAIQIMIDNLPAGPTKQDAIKKKKKIGIQTIRVGKPSGKLWFCSLTGKAT
ncbi:hypothetical protein FEDK69T_24730 [Flavobacterium enshiense DK69]|uniref:Uncharacterized protein n=1 Tax=Flavobacterium enshiense DK69 TaxID=1107311 RepID=V6S411_9FLAO|nr:hypothetical protein [Flavobacterium enshiense]ESU21406.1 hypothetical protein FEDK69T_24730 [Flavobacterium enshiense DK69]KGO97084.1 hypothetical protein Q767_00320 [Flavobacterium enshiense DK69]